MVGEDEPLVGDRDTRTATAEDDHRIGDTGLVQTVEGVDRETEAQFPHLGDVLLRQLVQEPHTLIRLSLVTKG